MASVGVDAEARRSTGGQLATLLGVALAVIGVDHATKWLAVRELADGPIDLFWTLRLRLLYNFGGSFGVGEGRGTLISVVGIGVSVWLVAQVRRPQSTLMLVSLGFFLGGALGNIIDRVARADDGAFSGGVVDFIDFQWWPVFNVADICLYVGIGLLVLASFRERDATTNETEPPT